MLFYVIFLHISFPEDKFRQRLARKRSWELNCKFYPYEEFLTNFSTQFRKFTKKETLIGAHPIWPNMEVPPPPDIEVKYILLLTDQSHESSRTHYDYNLFTRRRASRDYKKASSDKFQMRF